MNQLKSFFESLAHPDRTGEWLLPALDSVQVRINNWQEETLLESMERLVVGRLNTNATKSIRCITLTAEVYLSFEGFGPLFKKRIDTFRLFVPEVIVCSRDMQ